MSKKCEPTPDALQREIEERCNAKEAELERLRAEKRAADAISRDVIADKLAKRHGEIAAKIESNPAQLELNVAEARAHFMDAWIVVGNLRANEITNRNDALAAQIRQQVQIAMGDAAAMEWNLLESVAALAARATLYVVGGTS